MQYNCLTYLLNLFSRGERFTILYNSHHCVSDKGHDLGNVEAGDLSKFLPIENCHEKRIIKKIFNLDEKNSKILDEYFAQLKNN